MEIEEEGEAGAVNWRNCLEIMMANVETAAPGRRGGGRQVKGERR